MKIIPLLFISLFTVACSQESEFYKKDPQADKTDESVTPEEPKKDYGEITVVEPDLEYVEEPEASKNPEPVPATPIIEVKPEVVAPAPVRPVVEVKPEPVKPVVEVKPEPVKPVVEVKPEPAVEPGTVTEKFTQSDDEKHKVDIVWIVDNSLSMEDEQKSLGKNFKNFIENFITQKIDFQMAITTTDSRPGIIGTMVPGSAEKLSSKAAQLNPEQFKSDFRKMINVGVGGSGIEMGLAAMDRFLKLYKDSFLRPSAYLVVIYLTDEEDQSHFASEHYANNLQATKQNAGLIKTYSIVDTDLSTTGRGGITLGYDKYARLSDLTAGKVFNIKNSFDDMLTEMGTTILDLMYSFALAGNPDASSIRVKVNGKLVSGYKFDANNKSIVFSAGSVPAPGSSIEVSYKNLVK